MDLETPSRPTAAASRDANGARTFAPDADQTAVLAHGAGPLLVTGGPGTGKTAVLVERFAGLIEGGADPERVALVVRSRRAREVARAGLLARLRASLSTLRIVTVHGLAHHVMSRRFALLDYERPPEILTALDQFAKVRELLDGERPEEWPAYGPMLRLRGFADEVRQFLLRAQEALLQPEQVAERARATGLGGWRELAAFYARYLQVLDAEGLVDFAGSVEQAAAAAGAGPGDGETLFDHLLVDDYQDATYAMERLLADLAPASLVVAGDPDAHVFSFQGTTDAPIRRFVASFQGAHVVLSAPHRSPADGPSMQAWWAPHTSEEHAALARELRRTHVEEGVPWGEMAVVVRRQGSHLGGLLRALDDAAVPRAIPERALSLKAEPATFPFVMAFRWLARPEERDELVEPMLTSVLGGLSPAAARGLIRAAQTAKEPRSAAVGRTEGLSADEAAAIGALRDALEAAATVSDRSPVDAFRALWSRLPHARRLVEAAEGSRRERRDLDAIVALSDAVGRASERPGSSVASFLELLEAGDEGPGSTAPARATSEDAVRIFTAHGAAGEEFDTLVVVGAVEGNFPSLSRPEPMFDLAVLERRVSQSERNRLRLEDERRLFHLVTGRARRRVLFSASDPHGESPVVASPSRFVAEAGVGWEPAPAGPFLEPLSVAEAAADWRRRLADGGASAPERLAALSGILALGDAPARWWFQRPWSGLDRPLHETIRVSHSRLSTLENCHLQFVLGQEIGLEGRAGYHAWVGNLVHKLIENCENGVVERSKDALVAAAQARWRQQEFPSLAVSEAFRRLVTDVMLPAWIDEYGATPAIARELRFEFEFDGATVTGFIDRVSAVEGGGTCITDYKTGKARNATKAEDNLQLGIYYLALNSAEGLEDFRPVRGVELTFLRDRDWRTGQVARASKGFLKREQDDYREAMSERLSDLIGVVRQLQQTEVYRPNPKANCRFCDFKTLCPIWPEGKDVIPVTPVPANGGGA